MAEEGRQALAGAVQAHLAVHVHLLPLLGCADGPGQLLPLPQQMEQEGRHGVDVVGVLAGSGLHRGLVLLLRHGLFVKGRHLDLGDVPVIGQDTLRLVHQALELLLYHIVAGSRRLARFRS